MKFLQSFQSNSFAFDTGSFAKKGFLTLTMLMAFLVSIVSPSQAETNLKVTMQALKDQTAALGEASLDGENLMS